MEINSISKLIFFILQVAVLLLGAFVIYAAPGTLGPPPVKPPSKREAAPLGPSPIEPPSKREPAPLGSPPIKPPSKRDAVYYC